MQPAKFALTADASTLFVGSDGRLTIDVPAGAISSSEMVLDGGATYLLVRQILPSSGSNAGSSGQYSFGTYLIQVVDASGALASHGLDLPLTLTYHYGTRSALDVAHAYLVLNGQIPPWVNLDPSSVVVSSSPKVTTTKAPASTLPALASSPAPSPTRQPANPSPHHSSPKTGAIADSIAMDSASLDPTSGTLSSSAPLSSPTTSVSWGTDAPVATFGKPDPFEVDLSGGSLTAEYPIYLPAGPKGQKPPLSLVYNSAGVADQHNPQGAAPWVGEGWNLTLGSISWAEHNVTGGSGNPVWESSWELNDPYGTSAELIPPNTTTSIYYDDAGNSWSSPVQWQTAPETHAKVYSYTGLNAPGGGSSAPCFRVFLTNGIKEEFGCTPDSLQWYPEPSGANAGLPYIASWLLDLIIDSDGNQIRISYLPDTASGYHGISYPRDIHVATVQWDSPGCSDINYECGVYPNVQSWAPLMQVSFQASHSVVHVVGSTCTGGGSPRCDDPLDLSGSGGIAAPAIQNTWVLNDMQVQVRSSGTGSWNTVRDYQFSYDEGTPYTITDPISGLHESTAGRLDLTRLTVFGADGTTALPYVAFTYGQHTEYYVDSLKKPNPSTNCGPSWNAPCNLWSQSYSGNSFYLTAVTNEIGLNQTFSWQNARDNMHGVNGGGTTNTQNPFYCNGGGVQSSWPCYDADDETWSRTTLMQRQDIVGQVTQAGQGGTQTSINVTSTTNYSYQLVYPLVAQECGTCVAGYSWGNQNDNDYLDFYNGKFMGFAQVGVGNPDGSVETHKFYSTEGWGLEDTTQVSCLENPPNPCHNDPWWDQNYMSQGVSNVLHGHEYEFDLTDTDGVTRLQQVLTTWSALCPPVGVSGSPPVGSMTWWGNLVSELDLGNPVAVCDIHDFQVDRYTFDGSTNSSHLSTAYAYGTQSTPDPYGRLVQETDTSYSGGANGSPTMIVHTTGYIWNDAVTATSTSATGYYLIDFVGFNDTEDASGNQYQCTYDSYGGAHTLGQNSLQLYGDVTRTDSYTTCGNSPSGPITTKYGYSSSGAPFGNLWWTMDPDANAGISGHTGCTVNGFAHSKCTAWDATFGGLVLSQGNALNQTSYTNYQGQPGQPAPSASGGFGLWPISSTDVNNQVTSYAYDPLGRQTGEILPGEGTGLTTLSTTYAVWCGSGAQTPCAEIDRTQRLNSTQTVTYRAFYDGLGRLVETRTPSPSGDVVQYYLYYASQGLKSRSIAYFVTAYTGGPGSAAYSIPDTNQAVTTTVYDGLGRTTLATDPLSEQTTTGHSIVCNPPGTGDSACYEQTLTKDALQHQSGELADALGRVDYGQRYTGNSPATYALYATTKYTYDYAGDLTKLLHPDGVTTTRWQYDMAGRLTSTVDPDLGTFSSTSCPVVAGEPALPASVSACNYYDQDRNLTESINARGSSGTVFAAYDGIDRQIWRNTTNSPTGAYDTYSYDSTASGNLGVGQLTGETFSGAPNNTLSGSYSYVYDNRGRQTTATLTVGSTSYPLQTTYDDAGNVKTQTYPDGETVTSSWTAQGWFAGVSTVPVSGPEAGISVPLLSNPTYSGPGGANALVTGASFYFLSASDSYSATYDLLSRATDVKLTRNGTGATDFEETRTFDAAGNVSATNTTLPAGTDHQAFCYDEQNRLTAAASSGTVPCQSFSAGTLSAANYNQSFTYDNLGRLASGPLGTYTYGNSAHVHAATAIGSAYTGSYDPAGDMTCRAPSSATTCSGTQTGAQLTYNNESLLSNWQNQPSSPTSTAAFLYDGQGNRVEQQVTSSGSTTSTVYIGGVEEDVVNGSKTTYYYANVMRVAMAINGVFYHLATDQLGSVNIAFDANGNVTASLLNAPYGSMRYLSGTMPTDYGFTGQHSDAASGLDYYGARYYDPVAGQFTSADTVLPGKGFDVWGLSRYAYVEGNPVDRTDPTGHRGCSDPSGPCTDPIVKPLPTGTGASHSQSEPSSGDPNAPPPDGIPIPSLTFPVLAPTDPQHWGDIAMANAPTSVAGDMSTWDFDDPTKSPGNGWIWEGKPGSKPGDVEGNWHNRQTEESLWGDPNHGPAKGPHWDYRNKRVPGKGALGRNGQITWITPSAFDGGGHLDLVRVGIFVGAAILVIIAEMGEGSPNPTLGRAYS